MSASTTTSLPGRERPGTWLSRMPRNRSLLIVPALALVIAFFVYPVVSLSLDSVLKPTPGFTHYVDALTSSTTTTILIRTLKVAAIVTALTLALSYPYAYLLTLVRGRARLLLVFLVLLPFWTSLMARTFAWVVLLQPGGIVAKLTSPLGIGEAGLLGTQAGVTLAMAQVLLPFMVLPLYSSMTSIDRRLLAAAQSMGASRWTAFRTVFLPLSVPGVAAGSVLVFILSIGFWVTPRLVGSPQQSLVGQLIATKVEKLLDFESAGALSVIILVVTAVILVSVQRIVRRLSPSLPTAGGDR